MGRYLAIDYGSKRCGIAVSDPSRMIAYGLETVASHELMQYLENYFQREEVDCVVFGKPMQHDQRPSESFILVERFVKAFKKRFPQVRTAWEDERFTSRMAVQSMVDAGVKKSDRRKKENVDRMSAALILQSYMEQQNN